MLNSRCFKYCLAFIFTTVISLPSQAASKIPQPTQAQVNKMQAHIILENASHESLLLFAAIKGYKHEDLKFLRNVFKKSGKPALPAMTIKNDILLIDGKSSGIKFSSYAPMNLQYQGKIWAYDKSKTLQQNHQSLQKFFQPHRSAGYSLFINSAYADENLTNEIQSSALGALAALTVVLGTVAIAGVAIAGAPAVIIVGMTALIGAGFGWIVGQQQPERQQKDLTILKNIDSNFKMSCSAESVKLVTGDGKELSILKKADRLELFTGGSTRLEFNNMPENQQTAIRKLAECDTTEKAEAVRSELIEAARIVKAEEAAAQPAGAEQGASGVIQ